MSEHRYASGMIYLDYQATTPVDPAVVAAMQPYFSEVFGNPHSAEHAFGHAAHDAIERARAQIANCIESEPEDLVFTSGATEANNLAILGAMRAGVEDRDRVLVASIEHSSVLAAARAGGSEVLIASVSSNGLVDLAALESQLSRRVLIVSIALVNNEIGTIQDIRLIADLAHSVGALLHVDGAQALTAVDINVSDLRVDFLSLSSHKAYGPKGVGALYIAPGRREDLEPLIYGGGQEHGLRAGTLPTSLCVGFGAACELIRLGGKQERVTVTQRRDALFREIKSGIPGAELIGSPTRRHPGNLSIRLPVQDARDVVQLVQPTLACSTGSACHSGTELPSHVLLNLGLTTEQARQVVRLGVGRFSTAADCRTASAMLCRAVQTLSPKETEGPTHRESCDDTEVTVR